jgi:hypothetical protein
MAAATAELNRAQALQREIWAQAVAGCQETGSPAVMTLVLDSVNEMIDIAATRTGGLADASADNNSRNAGTAGACFVISGWRSHAGEQSAQLGSHARFRDRAESRGFSHSGHRVSPNRNAKAVIRRGVSEK